MEKNEAVAPLFFNFEKGGHRLREIWEARDTKELVTSGDTTRAHAIPRRARRTAALPSKSVPDCIIERE